MIHDEYVQYEKKLEEKELQLQSNVAEENLISNKTKPRTRLSSRNNSEEKADEAMSQKMLLSAKIIERMVTQNIYSDIVYDFKYWEDRSDDFKDQEGTLYPLWQFKFDRKESMDVTCLCWNHLYTDLFAVGYGSYDLYDPPDQGQICLFSLKNCSHPEFILTVPAGVLSVDFHPKYPYMLVAGTVDGNVAVFNLKRCKCNYKILNQISNTEANRSQLPCPLMELEGTVTVSGV